MTLTDFLLARITEDEATAREDGADAMVGWRWKHFPPEAYEVIQSATLAHSKRVLAECEAKRRIVTTCGLIADDPSLPSTHLARHVLADLARPYADHPDYREEWKP